MRRFECVFVEDDEFGGIIRRLKDNETGIVHMTCDVADLLNFQNTQIKCLKEENKQLKKRVYDFEKRKIIEESEMGEDVIPRVELLRTELFGEKYE